MCFAKSVYSDIEIDCKMHHLVKFKPTNTNRMYIYTYFITRQSLSIDRFVDRIYFHAVQTAMYAQFYDTSRVALYIQTCKEILFHNKLRFGNRLFIKRSPAIGVQFASMELN